MHISRWKLKETLPSKMPGLNNGKVICRSKLTFVLYRVMSFCTFTDVSEEAIAPTRIPMITSPVKVHAILKIRAAMDLGERSPYLLRSKQKIHKKIVYYVMVNLNR